MRTSMKLAIGLLLACAWGAPQAQTCATGALNVAPVANLTFPPVTLNADGTAVAAPVAYNLYQGTSATSLVKVSSTIVAGTANTIKTGLVAGATYYWAVTAVDAAGVEGPQSNVVCKAFPKTVPGTTTLTVT